jgi:beta-propeller repeat-containing protein
MRSPPASTSRLLRQFFNTGPSGILSRSNDGGATWTTIGAGLPRVGVDVLAIARSDAAIMFATSLGALFVSRDRGDTFQRVATPWSISPVAPIAIDPGDARTVFIGARAQSDGFVAKIAPGGGALEYATYLGGANSDIPAGVVVDDLGRAIVFGSTDSIDFPAVAPLQQPGSDRDGFVSVLDGGGSVLLTSTWVGGRGVDRIASAARRGRELIITGGSTDLPSMFPGANVVTAGGFVGVLDLSYGALERTRALALVRPFLPMGSSHLNRE